MEGNNTANIIGKRIESVTLVVNQWNDDSFAPTQYAAAPRIVVDNRVRNSSTKDTNTEKQKSIPRRARALTPPPHRVSTGRKVEKIKDSKSGEKMSSSLVQEDDELKKRKQQRSISAAKWLQEEKTKVIIIFDRVWWILISFYSSKKMKNSKINEGNKFEN